MRWLDNITDSTDVNSSKLQKTVKDREVPAPETARVFPIEKVGLGYWLHLTAH